MKTVPLTINGFKNDFYFLHNFYPCPVLYEGLIYPSAEHAYQASKTDDDNTREIIRNLLDGQTAKSYAASKYRSMKRQDWIRIRESVMLTVIQSKFFNNINLAKMLAETGNSAIINSLSNGDALDTYWGVRGTRGENRLGVILMHVRTQIQDAVKRAAEHRLSRVKFSGVCLSAALTPEDYESLRDHEAANNPDREDVQTP